MIWRDRITVDPLVCHGNIDAAVQYAAELARERLVS